MNEICLTERFVQVRDGIPMISTREIARIFERDHKNVLRDVRDTKRKLRDGSGFFDENEIMTQIREDTYLDQRGREKPESFLGRDLFLTICSGYTGERAFQLRIGIIQYLRNLENQKTHREPEPQPEQLLISNNKKSSSKGKKHFIVPHIERDYLGREIRTWKKISKPLSEMNHTETQMWREQSARRRFFQSAKHLMKTLPPASQIWPEFQLAKRVFEVMSEARSSFEVNLPVGVKVKD